MDNDQQTNNPTEEMTEQGKKVGRRIGNKIKQAGKKLGKHIAKKILAKTGKIAVKVLAKLVSLAGPYLLVGLILLAVVIAGYYVMYEIRGSQQIYVFKKIAENMTKMDIEKEYKRTFQDLESKQTQAIQQFYKYMSEHSYWQIIGDDNKKLEQDTGVRDYYDREKDYYLNSNFLFALDETMHRKKFIYPEQFIKHVNYDPDKLELKDLTDKKGNVTVEADEYDENGKKTGKKIKSVSDYGLGSIFKYKKDKRTLTVEGTMYKKEVWDDSCNCKKTVDTNEPFSYTMEGYPQDIYLMTKAITFVGEFSFEYETKKTPYDALADNDTPGKPNQAVKKVQVGVGKEYKEEEYTVEVPDGKGGTKKEKRTKKVFVKDVPLYGYRKGAVYESVPVLKKTTPNDKGQKYLRDFLYNYDINIPFSVMDTFNLEGRIGAENAIMMLNGIKAGTALNSPKFQACLQYLPIVQKHASEFGVDPYIVLAKMTQESGCSTTVEDGPMQIVGDGPRTVTATDISGKKQSFTVYNESDRRDMDKAVRWGVMYFANKVQQYNGDQLKALQSYNFDVGIIQKLHPEAWNTNEWLKYREEARLYHGRQEGWGDTRSVSYDCAPELKKTTGKVYGDVCYIEHVMQYYAGKTTPTGELDNANTNGTGTSTQDQNIGDKILDGINTMIHNVAQAFSSMVKDYSKETKYQEYHHFATPQEVDWGLRLAASMEKRQQFSDTDEEDLLFWEQGYSDQVQNEGSESAQFIEWNPDLIKDYAPPLNIKNPIVTSRYGPRWNKHHAGTDIAVPVGTPVYASADGKVVVAISDQGNSKKSWGNFVKIAHKDNNYTGYAHLSKVLVHVGQEVKRGQLIAYSGNSGDSTGPHLHFEFYLGGPETSKRVDSYPIAVQPQLFK